MLLCACAYGVKSDMSQVRNFAWHQWFSLQRCCKRFCFFLSNSVVQNVCVCMLRTSCLRAKIHYYYMWPFAKKLYHGWISTMTSSNEISWKLHLTPKWRAGSAPGRRLTFSEKTNKISPSLHNFHQDAIKHWGQIETSAKFLKTALKNDEVYP